MKKFLFPLALALPLCAAEKQHDIIVYGGTSGGVIAAIQAAKSKLSVVLVSPTAYLGGLTTSGLGCSSLWLAMRPDKADPQSADPVASESTSPKKAKKKQSAP